MDSMEVEELKQKLKQEIKELKEVIYDIQNSPSEVGDYEDAYEYEKNEGKKKEEEIWQLKEQLALMQLSSENTERVLQETSEDSSSDEDDELCKVEYEF